MMNSDQSVQKNKALKPASRMLAFVLALVCILTTVLPSVSAFADAEDGLPDLGSQWANVQNLNYAEWMAEVPGYYQISQLNIPGAHDAATKNAVPAIWAQCQDYYIEEQFARGIRYFDVRCDFFNELGKRVDKSFLISTHNGMPCFYKGPYAYRVWDNIVLPAVDYVKKHPTETIILDTCREGNFFKDYSDEYKREVEDAIRKMKQNLSEEDCLFVYAGDPVPTLDDCRGKIVVLEYYRNVSMSTAYGDHYSVYRNEKKKLIQSHLAHAVPMNLHSIDIFRKQGDIENIPGHYGNPDVFTVGINLNQLESEIGLNVGPRANAEEMNFYFLNNTTLKQGIRYGWGSSDFPSREMIHKYIVTNPHKGGTEEYYAWYYYKDRSLHIGNYVPGKEEDNNIEDWGKFEKNFRTAVADNIPWSKYQSRITNVTVDDEIHPYITSYWFCNLIACKSFDLAKLHNDKLVGMDHMFKNCSSVETIDLRHFSLSGQDPTYMNVQEMFCDCRNLKTIYAANGFNFQGILENVRAKDMFLNCVKLTGGYGTKYDSNKRNTEYACIDSPAVAGYFTEKTVQSSDIWWGFNDAKTLTISSQYSAQTPNQLEDIFEQPPWTGAGYVDAIQAVKVLDTVIPKTTAHWFENLKNCSSFDLAKLDLSASMSMESMFDGCSALEEINLTGWCQSIPCGSMFRGCTNLKTIYAPRGFSLSNQVNSNYMFAGCEQLTGGRGTTYDATLVEMDHVRAIVDEGSKNPGYFTEKTTYFWGYDNKNETLSIGSVQTERAWLPFNDIRYDAFPWSEHLLARDVGKVDIVSEISPRHLSNWFAGCTNCKEFDLQMLDTSLTQDMDNLFRDCAAVRTLDLCSFRCDSLESAEHMFAGMTGVLTIYADQAFDLSDTAVGENLFTGDTKLMGRFETMLEDLEEGQSDRTFARIDNPNRKGLFTEKGQTLYWGYDTTSKTLYLSSTYTDQAPKAFEDNEFYNDTLPWRELQSKMENVVVLNPMKPVFTDIWFYESAAKNFDLKNLDTSDTFDMDLMFSKCKNCEVLDISGFSIESLRHAVALFENSNFKTIYVSAGFDFRVKSYGDFQNLYNEALYLVGGEGTRYTDHPGRGLECACYDGKDGAPGLFTLYVEPEYDISFVNYDDAVLQTGKVTLNTLPVFTGETPQKEPTDTKQYTFRGWDREIVPAVADATYKAEFQEEDRKYIAKFIGDNEEILDIVTFAFGEEPKTIVKAERKDTELYHYEFIEWKFEKIDKDGIYIYRPVFEETYRLYQIRFLNDSTTVLKTYALKYNAVPDYDGETPQKARDGEYSYAFTGWAPEIAPVTANADYTAVFEKTPVEYRFTKGDGSIFRKGDRLSPEFAADGALEFLKYEDEKPGIYVDGAQVDPENYTMDAYEVRFVFDLTYLNGLTAGEHKVKAVYRNGSAPEVKFTVTEDPPVAGVPIYKVDAEGNALEGAWLTVRGEDINGANYSYSFVTPDHGCTTLNLEPGTYVLTEDATPSSLYEKAEDIRFKVYLDEAGELKIALLAAAPDESGTTADVPDDTGTDLTGSDTETGEGDTETGDGDTTGSTEPNGEGNPLSGPTKDPSDEIETPVTEIRMVDRYVPAEGMTVPFEKIDRQGNPVSGAEISIEGLDVNFSCDWETDGTIKELKLHPGTYLMMEDRAPEGYRAAENIIFRVKPDLELVLIGKDESGEEIELPVYDILISMTDQAIVKRQVVFTKVNEQGSAIGGAELSVQGIDNNYVYGWKTKAGEAMGLTLEDGSYVLKEITAPAGYQKAGDISFRISWDGSLWTVTRNEAGEEIETPAEGIVMTDASVPGTVKIFKTDELGTLIGGAQLKLEKGDGTEIESWTSAAGEEHSVDLVAGTYKLTETAAPQGFAVADPITFRVKEDLSLVIVRADGTEEDAIAVIMKDKKIPVPVVFAKTDELGASLGNAQLRVEGVNVYFSYNWTTEAGKNMQLQLWPGTYTMKETEAPEGYLKAADITFKVLEDRTVVLVAEDGTETAVETVVMRDIAKKAKDVMFRLIDGTGSRLADGVLQVLGTDNTFSESWTSRKIGDHEIRLWPGSYVMKELAVPEGYNGSADIAFRVKDDGTLVLVNGTAEIPAEAVVMTNIKKDEPVEYRVTFSLRDGSGNKLGGGGLRVEGSDSSYESEWISVKGSDKELTLRPGSYTMKELFIPVGYTGSADIAFRVKNDGTVVTVSGSTETPVSAVVMTNAKKTDPEPTEYHIIQGANSSWTHGSGITHRFASDAPFSKFVGVKIDGAAVAAANYTAFEGSTVIDLKPAYLDTLAIGTHRIEIVSSDGSASTNFTIRSGFVPPKTGDAGTALWITLMACSASAAGMLLSVRKRKEH